MKIKNQHLFLPISALLLVSLACQAAQLPVRQLTLTPNLTETATVEGPGGAGSPAQGETPQPQGDATQANGEATATPTATRAPAPTQAPVLAPPAEGRAGEQSIGDPYSPELGNTGYDVSRYTLVLTLDPATAEIEAANVTVEASATRPDLGQISLDFAGFDIDGVTLDGVPAQYGRTEYKLLVNFPRALGEGDEFTIQVAYHGAPVMERSPYAPFEDHLGMFFVPQDERLYAASEPDGSRFWFPCNDHPLDKAAYRFVLTVPEGLTAVANGRLEKTETELPNAFADGRAGDRFTWDAPDPMATYLAMLSVAEYQRIDSTTPGGITLRSYVFPEQVRDYRELEPTLAEAVDWMSDTFAPYPFTEFGYVMVDGFPGALETQTMILQGVLGEEIMVHEMAHQWFGDWVALKTWGDIWLNEGFATYIAALWDSRDDPARMDGYLKSWQRAMDGEKPVPLNNPQPRNMFGPASYEGGAWLLAELRAEVGDDAFFKGLKIYLDRHGGSNANSADLQAAMEESSGKSLDAFFAGWLE